MKIYEQGDIFDIEDIDWGKVDAARTLFQSEIIVDIRNFLKEKEEAAANAEPDMDMKICAGILRKFDNWLYKNFDTPEMDIALRMLFEHSCATAPKKKELTAKDRLFLDRVTKMHSQTSDRDQNEEKKFERKAKEPQPYS